MPSLRPPNPGRVLLDSDTNLDLAISNTGTIVQTPSTSTTNESRYDVVGNYTYPDLNFSGRLVVPSLGGFWKNFQFESLTPSICTVNSTGVVGWVSNGTGTIRVTGTDRFGRTSAKEISVDVSATYPTLPSAVFVEFEAGSLAKHINDWVDAALVGMDIANNRRIWARRNNQTALGSSTFEYNTNNWLIRQGVHMGNECYSSIAGGTKSTPNGGADQGYPSPPAFSMDGSSMIAISPRHVVFSAHYQPAFNSTVRFVLNNNTVVERVILARRKHPDNSSGYDAFPDIVVGLLDSDLPGTVIPAKTLPTNWADYLPGLSSERRLNILSAGNYQGYRIPAFTKSNHPNYRISNGDGTNKEQPVLLFDMNGLDNSLSAGGVSASRCSAAAGSSAVRRQFTQDHAGSETNSFLFGGDSSAWVWTIINGQKVLLNLLSYAVGSGTAIFSRRAAINALMSELSTFGGLGTDYQLETVDLSAFNSYAP